MEPLVSIALCTHNGSEYIEDQITSLINQTYQNLEIVIFDDNSSDRTYSILKKYSELDYRIILYRNAENLGYTKNFEQAIIKSNGSYIALCDQDDIWELNKIEILVHQIGENTLIFHDSLFTNISGDSMGIKVSDRRNIYIGTSLLPFLVANQIPGHAMMFTAELKDMILPMDENFFHDWWIAINAYSTGKVKYVPLPLVKYRQHANNVTNLLVLPMREKTTGPLNIRWIEKCNNIRNSVKDPKIYELYKCLDEAYSLGRWFRLFMYITRYYNLLFYIITPQKHLVSRIIRSWKICQNILRSTK